VETDTVKKEGEIGKRRKGTEDERVKKKGEREGANRNDE
jgi:hypothetical protein